MHDNCIYFLLLIIYLNNFVSSFLLMSLFIYQLETDMDILLKKAGNALRKYKMHAVVANELLTRKEEVTVVTTDGNISVRRDKAKGVTDVERPLIELLVEKHSAHIEDSRNQQ